MTAGRPVRSRWLSAGLAVLLVVAVGLWLRSTGPTERVPLPPVGASPEQVVGTYLEAMNAGDVDTINALVVSDYLQRSRSDSRWTVTDITIHSAQPESLTNSAAEGWSQAVNVPVTFRTTHAPDISIPDDEEMYWGYLLVRNKDTDPWRIIDQGVA